MKFPQTLPQPKKILLAIIVLAAFLRLYNLGSNPISPYWDEASIAVNANFIWQTGHDEHNQKFPILFEAFGEYKLPGQIYLTAPFVGIFGVNPFTTRLPAALMGTLGIFAIYLLTKALTKDFKFKKVSPEAIPLLAALFLAISPWHLQFTRPNFETSSALTLLMFALYFLFTALKNPRRFLFAAFFFSLSVYFYYNVVFLAPLLLITFTLLNFRTLLRQKKIIIVSIVLGMILTFPLLNTLRQDGFKRVQTTSILNLKDPATNPEFVTAFNKYRPFPIPSNLRDKIAWSDVIIGHYLSHYSPDFLFITGDRQTRHHVEGQGPLYIIDALFILAGLAFLLKHSRNKNSTFILLLFIFFPLPATFSDFTPHALRSSVGTIVFPIITAIGVISLLNIIKKSNYKKIFIGLVFIVYTVLFINYLHNYYTTSLLNDPLGWGYGHQQLVEYIEQNTYPQDNVIVTGRYWNPYIYFLYYSYFNPDPQTYLNSGFNKEHIQNIKFYGADWDGKPLLNPHIIDAQFDPTKTNILAVSPTEGLPYADHILTPLQRIYVPNSNQIIFTIYKVE